MTSAAAICKCRADGKNERGKRLENSLVAQWGDMLYTLCVWLEDITALISDD